MSETNTGKQTELEGDPAGMSGLRVLVVDDDKMVLELNSDILSFAGHHVIGVSDSRKAIEWYREHYGEIDVVVFDMMMPTMNGGDMFRAMKQINPRIKAVLLSGYGRNEEAQAILSDGALGFVQKPFGQSQFLEVVQQVASGEKKSVDS